MGSKVRIPKNPEKFDDYMSRTDDLQLTVVLPGTDKKYEIWGWKDAESAQWTLFRNESNLLYADFSNPEKKRHTLVVLMNELIGKVRSYDNNKETGHHLLDKVAMNGTVEDCLECNVVRGTVLQADPKPHNENPSDFKPVLKMMKVAIGVHELGVSCAEIPNSVKLPEGMAFVQVCRYIGESIPADLGEFEALGTAKRGKFKSYFTGLDPEKIKGMQAYYQARYISIKGETGIAGPIVNAPIMLSNT